MDHQAIKDLLPLAALDRLEPDEARTLQEHLRAGCDECEAELRELREAAASLALSLEQESFEEGSEDRIWDRLEARLHEAVAQPDWPTAREADSARRPARGRVGAWRAATAVMAAGIVGMAIYAGQIRDRLRRANENHQQEIAAMDSRIASMRAELTRARVEVGTLQRVLGDRIRLEKVLSAPDLRLTRLAPLAPAPGAGAIVAVSATNKAAVFQAAGLPATPPGKTYELWWITKEHGPVAAGLFQAEDGRPVVAPVSLPPPGEHVLLSAVTLEPAGGVSKPTGAMYLKGAPGPA
ncbi:MAG: anti-sigma factor [Candidatus Binataceae bacterium]